MFVTKNSAHRDLQKALDLVNRCNLAAVNSLNIFASTRSRSDILAAVLRNVAIALDSASSNRIVLLDHGPVNELVQFRIGLHLLNAAVNEVHSGLHSDQHSLSQISLGTQRLVAHDGVALHALGIAAHVVHINSHEVAEAVRHEVSGKIGSHHLLHISDEEALLLEVLAHHAVGVGVHIAPVDAGLHHLLALSVHVQHGLVDEALLGGELSVHRAHGGDIAGVALVLGSHVHQQPLAIVHLTVVGGASMSVVEDAAVTSRSANRNEGILAAASLEVGGVQEGGLDLGLVHLGLKRSHVVQMGLRANSSAVAVNLHFLRSLEHTALRDHLEQILLIDGVLLNAIEVS